MNYPLIENKESYPEEPICPVCKQKMVSEPHDFVALSGGALLIDGQGDSIDSDNLKGFLDLMWHSHDKNSSRGCFQIELVKDSKQGQFEMYFCSVACLRKFINELLDDFEKRQKGL